MRSVPDVGAEPWRASARSATCSHARRAGRARRARPRGPSRRGAMARQRGASPRARDEDELEVVAARELHGRSRWCTRPLRRACRAPPTRRAGRAPGHGSVRGCVRVAVNVEQLLQPAPGGIGRYTAALVRLSPHPRSGASTSPCSPPATHPRSSTPRSPRTGSTTSTPSSCRSRARCSTTRGTCSGAADPRDASRRSTSCTRRRRRCRRSKGVPLVVTVHDAAPITMPEATTRRGRWFHDARLRGGGEAERGS